MKLGLRRSVSVVCGSLAAFAAARVDGSALAGEEVLLDFEPPFDAARCVTDDARVSVVELGKGKALRVEYGARSRYPSVRLAPERGAWDLSAHGYVEAHVTNACAKSLPLAVRVDNAPGHGKRSNYEHTGLKPGRSGKLRVWFGRSWGRPGYRLDAAAVAGILVYLERPVEGAVLVVDRVVAGGRPDGWKPVKPRDGAMLDFGAGFDLDEQAKPLGGAVAKLVDDRPSPRRGRRRPASGRAGGGTKALEVSFGPGEKRAGVYLKTLGSGWDLREYTQVEADVSNRGDADATVVCRIDNRGGSDKRNSSLARETVKAGERASLKMAFGPEGDGRGFVDSDAIVGVLVAVEKPDAQGVIAVEGVRAAAVPAELPEWLGERPPVPGEWTMTLDENFDGPELDAARWTPRLCWDGPHGHALQRYSKDNVYVEDGKMIIKCEKRRGHQYDDAKLPVREYTTAAVTSLDKWTGRYGYFEARLKVPRALGLWPAFWTMPDRGRGNGNIWERRDTGNGAMEIDIFEHLTRFGPYRYNIACHWDGYGKDHKSWGDSRQYIRPTMDGFHHAGLLWEPGRLTWYCDGKKMMTYESARVSNVPEYFKFTVEMGGWAGGEVDDAALPDYFVIDYVRAWQKK